MFLKGRSISDDVSGVKKTLKRSNKSWFGLNDDEAVHIEQKMQTWGSLGSGEDKRACKDSNAVCHGKRRGNGGYCWFKATTFIRKTLIVGAKRP